jgi:hypothetical protein
MLPLFRGLPRFAIGNPRPRVSSLSNPRMGATSFVIGVGDEISR